MRFRPVLRARTPLAAGLVAAVLALPLPALAATGVPAADAALSTYATQVDASVRWNPDTEQLFVVWSRHAWQVYPVATANLPGETLTNTVVTGSINGADGPNLYLPATLLEADTPPAPPPPARSAAPAPATATPPAAQVARLIAIVRGTLGDPYLWGGTSPLGFDCSGLMQWAFAQVGLHLPRTSFEQWETGTPVPAPAPGDLVFFQTYAPGASHVGLAVGHGQFIDVGETVVRVDQLSAPYWAARYLGARDVLPST